MRMTSIRRRVSSPATLYRLIYRSRNNIPEAGVVREIRSILTSSRRNNMSNNVTGALLFTASGFAQVLEGPRDVVELTFERIGSDSRHADVMVLSFIPTERRYFPQWSMAFCGQGALPDPLAEQGEGISRFAGLNAATGSDVLRLLEKVIQREDEWIAA
jgi:hypothetical protein